MKLREGHVFTGVFLFTGGGVGGYLWSHVLLRGRWVLTPWDGYVQGGGYSPPGGRYVQGVGTNPPWVGMCVLTPRLGMSWIHRIL